jgi:hypothetical protein
MRATLLAALVVALPAAAEPHVTKIAVFRRLCDDPKDSFVAIVR